MNRIDIVLNFITDKVSNLIDEHLNIERNIFRFEKSDKSKIDENGYNGYTVTRIELKYSKELISKAPITVQGYYFPYIEEIGKGDRLCYRVFIGEDQRHEPIGNFCNTLDSAKNFLLTFIVERIDEIYFPAYENKIMAKNLRKLIHETRNKLKQNNF